MKSIVRQWRSCRAGTGHALGTETGGRRLAPKNLARRLQYLSLVVAGAAKLTECLGSPVVRFLVLSNVRNLAMKSMTRSFSDQALGAVGRDLESFFDQLFTPVNVSNGNAKSEWMPGVSIWEEADTFGIEMELPGMTMEDIELTFDEGRLTVRARRERHEAEGRSYRFDDRGWGEVTRSVKVPETVDPDTIVATYTNGVLKIHLSKRPEVLPRKIEIKAS